MPGIPSQRMSAWLHRLPWGLVLCLQWESVLEEYRVIPLQCLGHVDNRCIAACQGQGQFRVEDKVPGGLRVNLIGMKSIVLCVCVCVIIILYSSCALFNRFF